MIILNYLIALSLIIISVAKTADLFITSDRALTKTQDRFVAKTHDLHKNEKGSISLIAAIFTTILSALFMFYLIKMKVEYKEALYRKESYLCFHYLNVETQKYIKEMSVFNWALRSAFVAKDTVVNGVSGEILFKALTLSRNARHFNYLKKIAKNKFCKVPETISYLKNTPYKIQLTGMLETNIDETTIVRQNQWVNVFYKKPEGIRLKKSFCLKTKFQMEGAFSSSSKIETSEVEIKDLSSLKCFFGSSSSQESLGDFFKSTESTLTAI